jgi:hypothetical protein
MKMVGLWCCTWNTWVEATSDEALRLGPPNRVSVLSALFEGDKTVATRSYLK